MSAPEPCRCRQYDPDCPRKGRPMTLRDWQLCSNNCPSALPCPDGASEEYRAAWDGVSGPKEVKPGLYQPGYAPRRRLDRSKLVDCPSCPGNVRILPEAERLPPHTLAVDFNCGVGDQVQFAHFFQLYKRRGWTVKVDCHEDKRFIWQAAGIEVFAGQPAHWPYPPPADFNRPETEPIYSGSKIAHAFVSGPWPKLGLIGDLWPEIMRVDLEGVADQAVHIEDRADALGFLGDLPRPIVLLHTRGCSVPELKNLPAETTATLRGLLLDRLPGSLVELDWDDASPGALIHPRYRHLARDWGRINLQQLAALYLEAGLLVGIDSGPFHFAALTGLPALGCFHGHYPPAVTLPRPRSVYMTKGGAWHASTVTRRPYWSLVQFDGDAPRAGEIMLHAERMLAPRRYVPGIGRDVMLQQIVREWLTEKRAATYDYVFRAIAERFPEPAIVETGCVRSAEDWAGAGGSTYLFGAMLNGIGRGQLYSIDNDAEHCRFARDYCRDWAHQVDVVQSDSAAWLGSSSDRIDVAYLDSLDVDSGGNEHAVHGLREFRAVESRIAPNGLVLIDDTHCTAGEWAGKGALSVPYALAHGWRITAQSANQVVLERAA